MKKSLIALAVLAASGAAMAQSSVTLFGIIDAGVGYVKSDGAGHTTGLLNGGNSTSRLGFRGTEDLGGGLAASFWLEGALNNDVGGGASQTTGFDFQRRSTVSLSGAFGEIRLGRDFAATYLPSISYDVSGQRGFEQIEQYGATLAGVGGLNGTTRVSNAIAYVLPSNLGGFYGNLQYAFGERNSRTNAVVSPITGLSATAGTAITDKTGDFIGGRLGYANGPLDVGGSYGVFRDAVRTVAAGSYAEDYKIGNLGASYDFGIIKPMVFVQQDRIDGQAAVGGFKMNTYSIGATAPLGAGVLRAQANRYDVKDGPNVAANKFSLGYVYNLSKRTAVYADVARINNQGAGTLGFTGVGGLTQAGPTAGDNTTAVAVGVKHSF
ncbi:porin [Xylophilus sp. GOD-11R]|uniref:porin n=1 Tax=Xylophilus sp. GOD-11R TaxID=3089814 RepID=UPI00298D4A44|nr:porin [Xylophilus sp. GOD-11R]WPB57506.1 porin [Xylophilus sp. GOD-11R]